MGLNDDSSRFHSVPRCRYKIDSASTASANAAIAILRSPTWRPASRHLRSLTPRGATSRMVNPRGMHCGSTKRVTSAAARSPLME